MLFNSYPFLLVFLPVVLTGCFMLARRRASAAVLWLLFASLFFYGWWDARYVFLLAASVGFNYLAGQAIVRQEGSRSSGARAVLGLAISVNLGVLAYFKFAGFFVANVNALLGASLRIEQLVLPLGISFFTFTQIAYLVDMYREPSRYRIVPYALFVTYFPHLIAGPILHHREMMPQFTAPSGYRLDYANLAAGLAIFSIGLFKKTVLADGIGPHAAPVFELSARGYAPGLLEAWGACLAYGLQLYFDFSGYSDMAIGVSKMLGIRLPVNFDSPYKATSIIEFWRRWHMTLSRFLRDYLYVPLGGSRHGALRHHLNLFVTMLLGGLWHGAGWTFVAWGAVHGVLLMANHGWRALRGSIGRGPPGSGERVAGGVLTFAAVFAAWVLFRAEDFHSAVLILRGMAGVNGIGVPAPWVSAAGALATWVAGHWFGGTWILAWLPPQLLVGGGIPVLVEDNSMGVLVSATQAMWIVALLVLVWFAPNTWQLTARTEAMLADRRSALRTSALLWKPTPAWAVASALLLTASILSMARVSEFLYFQF